MEKLQQASPLTTVIALKQETCKAAKVMNEKKEVPIYSALGQGRFTLYFLNKTIYENTCKGENCFYEQNNFMMERNF